MDKRTLNKLQKVALKTYKSYLCTKCGEDIVVTNPHCPFYKSVKVHIQLCAKCAAQVVVNLLDKCCDGHDREMTIDKLTQYGQI